MKKILLTLAVLITTSNLVIGIAYSAVCESSGGARACGDSCTILADGACKCTGSCSAGELKWVSGSGGGDEELQ